MKIPVGLRRVFRPSAQGERGSSVRIVARRMDGPPGNEHVAEVRWIDEQSHLSGTWTKELVLAWLDDAGGTAYLVTRGGDRIAIGTRHPPFGARYIQAFVDPVWTDDLLALPSYDDAAGLAR